MKNEKVHRRRALFALEAIEVCATSCRKDWNLQVVKRSLKAQKRSRHFS